MEAAFCVKTLQEALAKHGKPQIFNIDQGSQFTGSVFTGVLANNGIAISMDGKGAWRDTVFDERLWRSAKYEEVYLRAYASVSEAQTSGSRALVLSLLSFGCSVLGVGCSLWASVASIWITISRRLNSISAALL
jgi:transposase InsO family protein